MPKFGAFTTVELLHRTALGCVYAARREGDAASPSAKHVVKTCEPDAAVLGAVECASVLEQFLSRAEAQRKLGSIDSARNGIAPIHDSGRFKSEGGDGAWYATDRAERGSCERLTRAGNPIDARALANIVRQVGVALAGLKQTAARPHGNLHPSNILLMDDAPAATARIALCDPLSDQRAAAPGRAGDGWRSDRRAVGDLIYQLVMHREFSGGWPVADSPQWQALGRVGAGWRDLCNKLLDPAPESAQAPGLAIEQLVASIPTGKAPAGDRRKWIVAGAVAAVVIGAVGLRLVIGGRGPTVRREDFSTFERDPEGVTERWRKLAADFAPKTPESTGGWMDQLVQAVGRGSLGPGCEPLIEKLKTVNVDRADLRKTLKLKDDVPWSKVETIEIEAVKYALAEAERKPASLELYTCLSDSVVDTTEKAGAAIGELKVYMTTEWPPGQRLARTAETSTHWPSEWGGATRDVQKSWGDLRAIDERSDGKSKNVVELLNRVANVEGPIGRIALVTNEIEGLATGIADDSNDAVCRDFAKNWMEVAVGVPGGSGAAPAGNEATTEEVAAKLEGVKSMLAGVQALLAEVNRSDLRKQVEAEWPDGPDNTREAVQTWVKLAEGSRRATGANPAAELDSPLKNLATEIEEYSAPDLVTRTGTKRDFDVERKQLLEDVSSLTTLAWVERTQDGIRKQSDTLKAGINRLREELRRELDAARKTTNGGVSEFGRSVQDETQWPSIRSQAIRSRGQALLLKRADEQRGKAKPELRSLWQEFVKAKAQLQALDLEIKSIDEGHAAAPAATGWKADVARTASNFREAAIASKVASLGSFEEGEIKSVAADINSQVKERVSGLVDLTADMDTLSSLLTTTFSLTEKVGDQSAESLWEKWFGAGGRLKNDEAVVLAVKPLRQRVENFEAIAAATDAQALIGRIDGAKPEEFDEAVAAWERLTASEGGVGWPTNISDFEKTPELCKTVNALWKDHDAAALRLKPRLARVWNDFAGRQTVAGTSKEARESGMAAAIEAMGAFGVGMDQITEPLVRLSVMLSEFAGDIDKKPDDDATKAETEEFVSAARGLGLVPQNSKLVGLLDDLGKAAAGEKAPSITELGPGKASVGWIGAEQGDKVEYTHNGIKVQFRRVTANGKEACVGIQEVSVELFIAIVAGTSGGWAKVRADQWLDQDVVADSWIGPCAWKWSKNFTDVQATASWLDPKLATSAFGKRAAHVNGNGVDLAGNLLWKVPSKEMPMHRISAGGALETANLIGCRLPTPDEWLAAYKSLDHGPGESDNVRDRTCEEQDQWAAGGLVINPGWRGADFVSPVTKSFRPKRGNPTNTNDNTLYFWPVTTGNARDPFTNLIGNVGEFALDGDNPENAVVFGASAHSDPALPDTPEEVSEAKWDVGFRLAFDATGTKPRRSDQVAKILNTTGLLLE